MPNFKSYLAIQGLCLPGAGSSTSLASHLVSIRGVVSIFDEGQKDPRPSDCILILMKEGPTNLLGIVVVYENFIDQKVH